MTWIDFVSTMQFYYAFSTGGKDTLDFLFVSRSVLGFLENFITFERAMILWQFLGISSLLAYMMGGQKLVFGASLGDTGASKLSANFHFSLLFSLKIFIFRLHAFYFISNTFISNARLKFANFQNIFRKIL